VDDSGSAPEYAALAVMGSGPGMEPHNEHKARASPDWPKWRNAMNKEITQLMTNNTWELVEHPPDRNVVGCHWMYRLKQDTTSKIVHYKARLVTQGFTQAPGINYNDTFTPVTKLITNHIILALAAHYDWEVHQMDIKNTYLNAKLMEKIYMEQPLSFTTPEHEHLVCCLLMVLYGLKQAG